MEHSKKADENYKYSFTQLGVAWLFTFILGLISFIVFNLLIESPDVALFWILICLAVLMFFCLSLAWHKEAPMFWQYSFSNIAIFGATLAAAACLALTWFFIVAVLIMGGLTVVMFYFNLGEAELRRAHKMYIPIHILTALAALSLAYLKYT